MRRAKIVCTLGPASSAPSDCRAGCRRDGCRPTQHEPWRLLPIMRRTCSNVREAAASRRAPGRRARRPPGPEDPARPVRQRQGDAGRTARRSPSPSTTSRARSSAARPRTRVCPGDVEAGDLILIDDGRLSLRGDRGHRHRRDHRGRRRRAGQQQQGHQPARRRRQRAGDEREGHRGPALGAAQRRRHGRAVLRPQRQGHRARCTR